jgi:hypothetical protein
MKLNPNQSSMQPLTFKRPNPPTPEAVAKAQFIDKTYQWNGSASAKAARSEPNN